MVFLEFLLEEVVALEELQHDCLLLFQEPIQLFDIIFKRFCLWFLPIFCLT
jgi:hypothetical protein